MKSGYTCLQGTDYDVSINQPVLVAKVIFHSSIRPKSAFSIFGSGDGSWYIQFHLSFLCFKLYLFPISSDSLHVRERERTKQKPQKIHHQKV